MTHNLWCVARAGFSVGLVGFALIGGLWLLGISPRLGQLIFLVGFIPMFISLFVLMILHHFRIQL